MFLKRIFPISIILLACLVVFLRYQTPCIENTDYTLQNGWQGIFDVKVERKREKCSFVPGAYYVFSSRQGSSENWQEIMTFRHDDPIEVPDKNVRIVNDKVALIFMGWKSAVTLDSGKTWNLWDAEKEIPNWQCCPYGLIKEVTMSENGEGIIILDVRPGKNQPKELFTSDFGKTWKQTK